MRSLLLSVVAALLLTGTTSFAEAKSKAKPATGVVSEATVSKAIVEFVDALNSLDDERVLRALAPADRLALRGKENLIGQVHGRKLVNPSLKSFEKIEQGGRVVGAKALVAVEEIDPIESTRVPKEKTWFLALDGKVLHVSLASVWLDAGRVGEPTE